MVLAVFITLVTSRDYSFKKSWSDIFELNRKKQEYQVEVSEKKVAKEYIYFDYEKIKKEIEGEDNTVNEKKKFEKIYENGTIEKYYEIDGIKSGKAILTYPNGDREEFNYISGVIEGEATYYFINGDKEVYKYKNGVVEGDAKYIFANGREEKYRYKNGARE